MSGMEPSETRQLVLKAQNGDKQAFSRLVQAASDANLARARDILSSDSDAQDVLADAYIKAYGKLDTLREPERFFGWFSSIVTNTAIDVLRKRKRKAEVSWDVPTQDGDFISLEEAGAALDVEDPSLDSQPELQLLSKERKEMLQKLLSALTPQQRETIVRFYFSGLSIKEIAQAMGCTDNTVKSRLSYGKKNLEKKAAQLQKEGGYFFSMAPLPLLLLLLFEEADARGVDPASFAEGGCEITAGTGAAGSAAGTGKAFFSTAAGRGVLGAAAVLLAGGIGFAVLRNGGNQETVIIPQEMMIIVPDTEPHTEELTESLTESLTEALTEPFPEQETEGYTETYMEKSQAQPAFLEISDEEYPLYLVNGITKSECEYVLAAMPEELDGSADQAAVTSLVEYLNTCRGEIVGEEQSYEDDLDRPLSFYNRYTALVSDAVLTLDTVSDYDRGEHACYEKDGEYYLPWYQISLWPNASVTIQKTIRIHDEIRIRYQYAKMIPGDDSTYSFADPIELTAVLTKAAPDGNFRVTRIRAFDPKQDEFLI